MADMEARSAGVGKHIHDEELGTSGDLVGIAERTGGIRSVESSLVFPVILPALFDISG
jgi:hypothetical protein